MMASPAPYPIRKCIETMHPQRRHRSTGDRRTDSVSDFLTSHSQLKTSHSYRRRRVGIS